MKNTHHPEPSYGIELRDGLTEDDYIAQARGFGTTAEWLEFRDASPTRRNEIVMERETRTRVHSSSTRAARENPEWEWDGRNWRKAPEPDSDDGRRYAEFLRITNE